MSDMIMQNLATNLAYLRKMRGLTQGRLAIASNIPRTTISHLESGQGNPSLKILAKLATTLGVSIEELISAPHPSCVLINAANLKRQARARGHAEIITLLPDPIPGLQFERLHLRPSTLLLGIPHKKGTKEYFTCTYGRIAVSVDGNEYIVQAGDVLTFPGDRRHSYRNLEGFESTGISIVVIELL
jgi:transcriptional regulator with XRE-family HTH domain